MTLNGYIIKSGDMPLYGYMVGAKGASGRGIAGIVENADYTMTISFTDGTTFVTEPIAGFTAIAFDADYNLVVTKTDGNTETVPTGIKSIMTDIDNDATLASNSATNAYNSEVAASGSASAALTSQYTSEAWAVGKRNGADVTPDDPAYHNNAKYYADNINATIASDVNDWLVAHPEATTTVMDGAITYPKLHGSISKIVTVVDSLAEAITTVFEVGRYIMTRGFTTYGDFGGGLYKVIAKPSVFTADNCTTFLTDDDKVLQRVFVEPFVYLESLNFGVATYSTILSVISSNNIHDVRAVNLSSATTIEIKDFDFTFNKVTYTGSGSAILLDGVNSNHIQGNEVYASSGTCITLTTTSSSCTKNVIDVRILSGKNGMRVLPINGKGVMHNWYKFGNVNVTSVGVETYIPANTGYYSWQGEDLYDIGNIKADATGGVAVSFVITPVSDKTVDGTITGVTFLNLAVEYSETGVYIRCGSTVNNDNSDACIKSITINNMRCREVDRTTTFLDAQGYIKDLYVKPTSPIKLSQWQMNISSYNRAFVDADVYNTNALKMIGKGLCSRVGKLYIKERMPSSMNITDNIYFSNLATNANLYMPDYFRASDPTDGKTVNLADYFYDESLESIYVSVGAGRIIYVVAAPLTNPIKLDNSGSAERRVFLINVQRYGNGQTDFRARVSDIGTEIQFQ